MITNEASKPEAPGPHLTVQGMIQSAALAHGAKTAVICRDVRFTYAQLFRRVRNLAAGLLSHGLQQGDRITILTHNCHRLLETDLLAFLYGFVACPVHPQAAPSAWISGIQTHGPRAILVAPSLAGVLIDHAPDLERDVLLVSWGSPQVKHVDYDALAEHNGYPALPALGPEDLVSLNLTSGTTGASKAVMHTQSTWAASASNVLRYFAPIAPHDIMLHVGPMTHSSSTFITPFLVRGGCAVIEPGFDPDAVAHRARLGQAGRFQIFPPMFRDLLENTACRRDLPGRVQVIEYGGSPANADILEEAMDVFGTVLEQGYGQTETMPPVTAMLPGEHTPGRLESAGKIIPGIGVSILDFEGNPLPPDAIGEIAVSGPNVTPGYWNNPDETRKRNVHGHWLTGDRGFVNAGGWLTLNDRLTDIIIRRGFNIAPRDVETAARKFPGVGEALAFAVPHPRDGEAVALAIVAEPGATVNTQALADHIVADVSAYAEPYHVIIIDTIPRNANGKIVREAIKQRFWKETSRNING